MPLQNWPIETVKVSSLALDLANVRIRVPQADEQAVLNYLYLYDSVDSLAHDFLRDGYLDNELPVVVRRDDGSYTVLEGNRRVAALKGLLSPKLVPAKSAQLERLINRYEDAEMPSEIRVMVAPNVAVVQPLLARLHTQIPKKGWPRDQQAAFYYAQIEAGASADSLRKLYSTQPGQISKFLKMATILKAVRTMKIEDADLRAFVRGDKLSVTAFEYAYLRVQVQAILKLAFTADGVLPAKSLTEAQRKGLIYILQLVKSEKLTTRTDNLRAGTDDNEEFLQGLRAATGLQPEETADEDIPEESDADDRDSTNTDERPSSDNDDDDAPESGGSGGQSQSGSDSNATGATGTRGPNSPGTLKYLSLDEIDYASLPQGLKRRYIELRKMDVQELPNASFDVLRTILECSIRVYCERIGSPVPAGVQLGGCLAHLSKQFPDKSDRGVRNIINTLSSGKASGSDEYFRSAEALNAGNHDPNIFVEGSHVHWAWEHMKPLLRRLAAPVTP